MSELFAAAYTPRRIRFLLLHWEALVALGEYPRTARATFTQLAQEWTLLVEDARLRNLDCCCAALNDGIPTREETGASGHVHGVPLGVDTRADLTAGADALPIIWQATRHVFALQGRIDTWAARVATQRQLGLPRPRDRFIEPPYYADDPLRRGSGLNAVRFMALDRGWRPRVDDVT